VNYLYQWFIGISISLILFSDQSDEGDDNDQSDEDDDSNQKDSDSGKGGSYVLTLFTRTWTPLRIHAFLSLDWNVLF
jgi:hypothetical protein